MVLKCQEYKSVDPHVAISSWHQQNIHPLKLFEFRQTLFYAICMIVT
jgi:hypothetical protein